MRISDWSSDVCSSDLTWSDGTAARFHLTTIRSSRAVARRRRRRAPPPPNRPAEGYPATPSPVPPGSAGGDAAGWPGTAPRSDRKGVVKGRRVSVRVALGGRRLIQKKKTTHNKN